MLDNISKMAEEENQCLRTDCLFFVCSKSVLLFFYVCLVKKLTPPVSILEEEPTAELLCKFSLEVRGRE